MMSVDLNKLHQYWYNHQEASGLDDTWSTLMLASYKPLLDEIDTLRSRVEELERENEVLEHQAACDEMSRFEHINRLETISKLVDVAAKKDAELARLNKMIEGMRKEQHKVHNFGVDGKCLICNETARCVRCGSPYQQVRPGKWQCPECE